MSSIAFKTEEFGEALKDFVGQIVDVDYALEPFGMKGAPEITRKTKVLAIQIRTPEYDKDQYEWYPPSRVKKTKPVSICFVFRVRIRDISTWVGSYLRSRTGGLLSVTQSYPSGFPTGVKWAYFIEALNATGAMREVSIAGANDEERMQSMAKSLLGMEFRFQEVECESLVKLKGGEPKTFNLLTPVEYLGKKAIEAAPEVRQATIGEAVGEPAPGEVATKGEALEV